ncbi:unnamed protein product [Polarella glacialis]|uniref:Uncharacterized protein n=1 Tax=Polarella glacialis TaxID=89957 RepID=A0A813ETX7_POLGL|nr:unnamed protein product [Polarella glacialis]|mmetsp:Transcript_73449/g.132249  ORF Transcript_73449/g.132249 Transcript_73449/m.132249 type:complete len:260 (-) Transcript_73449:140-919(-)
MGAMGSNMGSPPRVSSDVEAQKAYQGKVEGFIDRDGYVPVEIRTEEQQSGCPSWLLATCVLLIAFLTVAAIYLQTAAPKVASSVTFRCAISGDIDPSKEWSQLKRQFCCQAHDIGCDSTFLKCTLDDQSQGRWSDAQQGYCCENFQIGCQPPAGFNCEESFESWQADWSDEKKLWCCQSEHRGCPEALINPLRCMTPCTLKGQTATCHARIQYAATETFGHRENACGLAYSEVRVECPVCASCPTIQEGACHPLPVRKA